MLRVSRNPSACEPGFSSYEMLQVLCSYSKELKLQLKWCRSSQTLVINNVVACSVKYCVYPNSILQCLFNIYPLTPCARALQAADDSSPSLRRPDMVEDTGCGARLEQSASGTRYFADMAAQHRGIEVGRMVQGVLLGCVLAHTCRAAQPSSLASIRLRSR
jgi:hypothetical protein